MTPEQMEPGKKTVWWEWVRYALLLLFLYALIFRDPLEQKGILSFGPVLNGMTAAGIPAALWLAVRDKKWRWFLAAGEFFILVYCMAGMAGYRHYQYQSKDVTLMALYDSTAFWSRLCAFGLLFRHFPLKRFALRLTIHLSAVAVLLAGLTLADMALYIWPRQIHRHSLGSIQLFYGHPSMLAAAGVLVMLFLLLLVPYVKMAGLMAAVLIFPLFMTLRFRIWGFLLITVILVVWFGLLKMGLRIWVILGGGAAALAVGGRRLYDYYFSPYAMSMARGQFAHNSIQIARQNFPFGTGFATFGSRAAQRWYSPVYYWYNMYKIPGLDPLWPSYACDTFWPMILGESGVAGLAGYIGLTVLLAGGVLLQKGKGEWAYLTAMAAFLFELLESTGTLAFADTPAVGIALLLGLIFGLQSENGEKP